MTVEDFKELFEEWVSSIRDYKDSEIKFLVRNIVHDEFVVPGFLIVKIREQLFMENG